MTRLAYSIVTLYGMNDAIGNRSYPPPQDGQLAHSRPYSEKTAELVDAEVRAIANEAYERTLALLTEKKELMAALAQLLLEKEVIHKEDVEAVLGKRPFQEVPKPAADVGGMGVEAAMIRAGSPSRPAAP